MDRHKFIEMREALRKLKQGENENKSHCSAQLMKSAKFQMLSVENWQIVIQPKEIGEVNIKMTKSNRWPHRVDELWYLRNLPSTWVRRSSKKSSNYKRKERTDKPIYLEGWRSLRWWEFRRLRRSFMSQQLEGSPPGRLGRNKRSFVTRLTI